jgi:hypothetical protein
MPQLLIQPVFFNTRRFQNMKPLHWHPIGVPRTAREKVLTGRPIACSLQAYEKHDPKAPPSASRPEGRTVPASEKSAYCFSAGM